MDHRYYDFDAPIAIQPFASSVRSPTLADRGEHPHPSAGDDGGCECDRRPDEGVARYLFPLFYDAKQTESCVNYIAVVDPMLIDGTYFVAEVGDELVACGGWSRRDKLYTCSGEGAADARLLARPKNPPESGRCSCVRTGPGRASARSSCRPRKTARAEGFRMLALMSTMPGLPLYERYGFTVIEHAEIPTPDGTTIASASMEKPIV